MLVPTHMQVHKLLPVHKFLFILQISFSSGKPVVNDVDC